MLCSNAKRSGVSIFCTLALWVVCSHGSIWGDTSRTVSTSIALLLPDCLAVLRAPGAGRVQLTTAWPHVLWEVWPGLEDVF